jgi:hypothetical protein
LLEEAELLEGAVDILPRVGPRIAGVVYFGIGIAVAQKDSAVRLVVREGVEYMG